MFDFNSLPEGRRHVRKVQLGAGQNCPEEFINIDIAGSSALDIVQDLRDPLPFPDNSIEEFYSHHVLEHFTIPELTDLLLEVKRCLKVGGRLVSRLPDFEHATRQLLTEPPGERREALMLCVYGGRPYGWLPLPEHTHVYGWTTVTMRKLLTDLGYLVTECKSIGSDSTLPCIDFIAVKSTAENYMLLKNNKSEMWGERQAEIPWALSKIKPGTVLDVGAIGSPYISELTKNRDIEKVVLNDIREFNKETGSKKAEVLVEDVRKISPDEMRFDNILLVSTLEHIGMDAYGLVREIPYTHSVYYTQRDALAHMRKLLAPGGRIILTLPYGKWEDMGWLITYQDTMIAEIKKFFNVTEETYFTCIDSHNDIWQECKASDCPFKSMNIGREGIRAHSICCLVIESKE